MLPGNISDDEMLPPNASSQRKSIKTSKQSITNEILKSYQVTSYKYVDSKYESRGKIGMALIGSKVNGNFNLLLYGKGNAALAQANINKEFEVTSGADLYISFYDMKSENWSLLFETMEFYNDFLSRFAILKSFLSKQDLISLDIKVGEGIQVHDSDLCEVDIVICCVKNCDIISTLYASESNETNKITRLKVGANKLIPVIDKSIIGMAKGGHRIISAPCTNTLLKGGSLKFTTDVGIVAHMKIIRIRTKIDKPTTNNDSGETELSLPDLNFDQGNKETDHDASDQSKKSVLINKMKIMGKPLLEFHPIDSSGNNFLKNPEAAMPVNYSVPGTIYGFGTEPAFNQSHIGNQMVYPGANIPSYNNQLMPIHSAAPMMAPVHQSFQTLPNMLGMNENNLVTTENRQHNSEMRIAISKLQDKIDRISDKLDTNISIQKPSPSRHMDAENVFDNIKRIIDENEVMKRECSQKSDTIDLQNKRINELLNRNQQYLEDSRNVGDRTSVTFSNMNSENQSKILKLEEEKLELIRNLSKKTSELSQLEVKNESINCESQSYRNKSLEFDEQINKLMSELGDIKLKNRSLLLEIDKLNGERSNSLSLNENLESHKKLFLENERKLQHTIEQLKINIKDEKNNSEKVKSECENEIMEIRQNCEKEIDDLRNKLKNERKITSSKSINFDTEIDSVNKVWDKKFEEFKQIESNKLSKMNERNNQLIIESSSLTHELYELKNQLSLSNNKQSTKFEELSVNNKLLQRQLDEAHSKSQEIESLRIKNLNHEKEIIELSKDVYEMGKLKQDLELVIQKKKEMESLVKTLTEELNATPHSNTEEKFNYGDVDQKIKSIMNDVFKKIKMEFELDQSYHGKDVISKCMVIIRDSTVSLIKLSDGSNNEKEENRSDEESTDSDSSDDEISDPDDNVEEVIKVPESLQKNILTEILKVDLEPNVTQDEITKDETSIEAHGNEIIILENEENLLEEIIGSVHSTEMDSNEIRILENEESVIELENHAELNDLLAKTTHADEVEIKEKDVHQLKESAQLGELQEKAKDNIENEVEITEKDADILPIEKLVHRDDDAIVSNDVFDSITTGIEVPIIQDEEDSLADEIVKFPLFEDVQESYGNITSTEIIPAEFAVQLQSDAIKSDIDLGGTIKEMDDSVKKVQEKDDLFGSDDEDVSGFFEELNKKKKNDEGKVVTSKMFTSDDDDDLNWLHS